MIFHFPGICLGVQDDLSIRPNQGDAQVIGPVQRIRTRIIQFIQQVIPLDQLGAGRQILKHLFLKNIIIRKGDQHHGRKDRQDGNPH